MVEHWIHTSVVLGSSPSRTLMDIHIISNLSLTLVVRTCQVIYCTVVVAIFSIESPTEGHGWILWAANQLITGVNFEYYYGECNPRADINRETMLMVLPARYVLYAILDSPSVACPVPSGIRDLCLPLFFPRV